ncbi:putative membrane protein [Methanohalophilus levihalophilus]|uniref:COG2426 family protein n=1 Tax=Methanohalophilus levihalophilus TaxID=1431282 RepID=UPI001AE34B37|nr:small multi-drug export protein [Methanohalophilus levihalophilus]MBP2030889.1 putative membrane protein [Methanohalophilus levihalophilus]
MAIEESLVDFLSSVPPWISTIFLAALPISELRGAIPLAIGVYGIEPFDAYVLAVIGNMLPVIPLLLFLEPVSNYLRRFKYMDMFFDWLFNRTRKNHTDRFEKFGILALTLFVAVPLPVTGAWTGCAAAFVFGIRFKWALPAIFLGVLIAGIIVTSLTVAGISIAGI